VNPAFERMTGYTRAQVIGQTPRLLRSGVQSPAFYQTLWNTILDGRTFRAIMTNRRSNGDFYEEDQTITPIRDRDGAISHFVSCGRDITDVKRMQEALQRLNQQLEREAARVASVLHDEAGQFLTAAHLALTSVEHEVGPAVAGRLHQVRSHLQDVEHRLRNLSHEIHPRIVLDLGLEGAVRFLAEGVSRRSGTAVVIDASLTRRHDPATESVLYRVIQEGLTNAVRHARAKSVHVSLNDTSDAVQCALRDDGVGFDTGTLMHEGVGLGLRLMQDRIVAVGGKITISSTPDRGTEIRAVVPVEVPHGV
jgi:PAS domain S-box-containing protein